MQDTDIKSLEARIAGLERSIDTLLTACGEMVVSQYEIVVYLNGNFVASPDYAGQPTDLLKSFRTVMEAVKRATHDLHGIVDGRLEAASERDDASALSKEAARTAEH